MDPILPWVLSFCSLCQHVRTASDGMKWSMPWSEGGSTVDLAAGGSDSRSFSFLAFLLSFLLALFFSSVTLLLPAFLGSER